MKLFSVFFKSDSYVKQQLQINFSQQTQVWQCEFRSFKKKFDSNHFLYFAPFTAFILLVGQYDGHSACRKYYSNNSEKYNFWGLGL